MRKFWHFKMRIKSLAAALGETSELLCKTQDENDRLANFVQEIEGKRELEKKQFLTQIEELVFEKSKTESNLEDVQDKVMQLVNELACQKSESDQIILDLNTHLESKKAEMEGLQNKLGDLIYEKSQLHMEIGHLEAELKLAKSELEERKEEAVKALECIPELKNSIEMLNAEKCEAEKQALEMNYFNETLQSTLDKLQADFDGYSKDAEHDRSAAQSKIANLTEEVEGLKEQKDEMAQKFDDWLSEKYELEFEITKLQCRIQVIEMEADQSKQEIEKELQQYKDEKEHVTQEKRQMERSMEQYGIELLNNAAQLQSLQCQLDRKVADLELFEAVNAELKQEMNNKCDTVSQLEDNITALKESYFSKCSDCECAVLEKCQVVEQLKAQRKESMDLDCTLQQLRADFVTKCNERDELFKKNEAKDMSLAAMSQQMMELNKHVENLSVSLEKQSEETVRQCQLYEDNQRELVISSQKILNYQQQIKEFKENLQEKCEECDELQQKYYDIDNELTLASKEIVDLHEGVEFLRREKEEEGKTRSELIEKYEKNIEELKEQIHGANSSPKLEAELAKYRKLYEGLLEKVGPFMEQIDAYELEKQMLLGLNKDTQEEMERLGRNYAQLLGHQNQKQKIKHIVKIKDENNALKRENVALKEQVTKQKIQLMKLDGSNTTRGLDASKLFQNTKENLNVTTSSAKSPLKTVNRK